MIRKKRGSEWPRTQGGQAAAEKARAVQQEKVDAWLAAFRAGTHCCEGPQVKYSFVSLFAHNERNYNGFYVNFSLALQW